MQYFITKFDKQRIVDISNHFFPCEICGLIGINTDKYLHPLFVKNEDLNPLRNFRISNGSVAKAKIELNKRGFAFIGVIHSHPKTMAKPTTSDKNYNMGNSLWIIYSVCYKELKIYKWNGRIFIEQKLLVK
ncbi:Mov34/MPN/PAD-1 family protein [Zobellia nedashkovskayae]